MSGLGHASKSPPERSAILLVAPEPFYEDRGTPIAVRELIQALTQLDYCVDLVTYPMGRSLALAGVDYFRAANPFLIRHVPVGFSGRKLLLDATLAAALVSRLCSRRYAAIHAIEEAAFPAVMAGRIWGVPVIYDMQSSIPEQLACHRVLGSRPAQGMLRSAEGWLLKHADVVVGSSGLAQYVGRVAPEIRFREWCFPPAPPAASQRETVELRQALGIHNTAPVVVYSGTFAAYQGLPDLVSAIPAVLKEFPRTVFVLVGAEGGDSDLIHSLMGELVSIGAVRIIKRQRREVVAAYLALADVLVSTRAYGCNLPLKIFDYLAAGRPIVATDLPAHRTVLDPSRAELVEPTPQALGSGIVRLLQDPIRAAALAAEARRYAETRLGRIIYLRAVSELYADIEALGSSGLNHPFRPDLQLQHNECSPVAGYG